MRLCAGRLVVITSLLASQIAWAQRPTVASSDVDATKTRATELVLDRPVTVRINKRSLPEAIDAIGASAGTRILYRSAIFTKYTAPVSVRAVNLRLGVVLEQALAGTTLRVVPTNGRRLIITDGADDSGVLQVAGRITGHVTDGATKAAIRSATVTLTGTKLVARTDDDGMFRIVDVPAGTYTMTVRRLGYSVLRRSVTVKDDETLTVDVALTASSAQLDAVLTTVTGKQRRLEIANDIGVIKADSLVKEAPITTLSQLLTARVPGLAVTQGQGSVGGNVKLQIRNRSSLTLSNEPIVIVDGIRYTSRPAVRDLAGISSREPVSPLNDLNPNDIETVEVVKGPSAATLYGTDASNGVIVITTKRGKAGPPRWEMYGTTDYSEIPQRRVAQDERWYGWGRWTYPWSGPNDTTSACDLRSAFYGDCSLDSVTHAPSAGSQSQYSLFKPSRPWTTGASVSGGSQTLRYYFGGDYNQLIGAIGLPDTAIALARARGQLNLPKEFLRPNSQTNLSLRSNVSASAGEKTDIGVNGSYTHAQTYSIQAGNISAYDATLDGSNPYDIANRSINIFSRTSNELNDRFTGGANVQHRLFSWLSARGTAGIDWSVRNQTEFQERDSTRQENPLGTANNQYTRQVATTVDLGGTARFQRSWMSFQTSVGVNYNRAVTDQLRGTGSNLVPGTTSISFATTRSARQDYDERVSLGSYVEEQIGFNGRLFLTGAYRVDGATGFGDGYRSAGAPKVGASWLVSQEPFFPRIPGVTELRLRSAYGVSLRQARAISKLPSLSIVQNPFNGPLSTLPAYLNGYDAIGNPSLKPERSGEWENGLDASLLEQRVQLGLTWFSRRTHDQIVSQLMPMGLGSISENIGLTTAHGFEANLNMTLIDTRPFSLAFNLNHSYKTDKLVNLGAAKPVKVAWGGYVEGYPLGVRWNTPFLGYDDIDGNGLLTCTFSSCEISFGDTAVFAGLIDPPRTQQLTINVGLLSQRVRFSALFDRESGGTQVPGGAWDGGRAGFDSTTSLPEQAAYLRANSIFLGSYRADFTRLREMTMTVMAPPKITRALHVSSSSVSIAVRNLALWTSYPGRDPEVATSSFSNPLDDGTTGAIPQSRNWTLRFNLGL